MLQVPCKETEYIENHPNFKPSGSQYKHLRRSCAPLHERLKNSEFCIIAVQLESMLAHLMNGMHQCWHNIGQGLPSARFADAYLMDHG